MALKAGYKGIKKYIADKLNSLGDLDSLATDAEVTEAISDSLDAVVGWNQEDTHDTVETLLNGKVDNSVVGPVEDGETASQAYAVGEHFIKDGKFCTAIQTIAAEATLTKDTNYVEGALSNFINRSYEKTGIEIASNALSDEILLPDIAGYSQFLTTPFVSGTGSPRNCKIIEVRGSNNKLEGVRLLNTDTETRTWTLGINVMYVKSGTLAVTTLS